MHIMHIILNRDLYVASNYCRCVCVSISERLSVESMHVLQDYVEHMAHGASQLHNDCRWLPSAYWQCIAIFLAFTFDS